MNSHEHQLPSFPLMLAEETESSGELEVAAPYDRTPIARVAKAGTAAVESSLEAADRLFHDRDNWLPQPERIEILRKAAAIIRSRREELAVESAREGGKPLVDSLVEVNRAADCLDVCVETLRTHAGRVVPMNVTSSSSGRYATTHLEPCGPVVAFSAFNHPFNLIAHQVAPAVATGCPVIVKPASSTPTMCFRFVSILREAGLPNGWCQALVPENRDLSGRLVSDPRVAFFTFIGSGRVGWSLRQQLAPGTRCALEHGGAAPAIIAADAGMDATLASVLKGGFYHAGQVCVSVQRCFVEGSIASNFAERLATMATKLSVGDPTSPETEVGPLINPREVNRVHEWVEEALQGGAKLLCGGKKIGETCYAPTVLFNPPPDCRLSREEIFGPVVCVYSYAELDDAIERANDVPFSFQASVYSDSNNTILRATRRLNAAAVMVNDHTAFRVDWMPFAGLKESGYGIGGIPYTMDDMQVEKLVVYKSNELS